MCTRKSTRDMRSALDIFIVKLLPTILYTSRTRESRMTGWPKDVVYKCADSKLDYLMLKRMGIYDQKAPYVYVWRS